MVVSFGIPGIPGKGQGQSFCKNGAVSIGAYFSSEGKIANNRAVSKKSPMFCREENVGCFHREDKVASVPP